MIEWLKIAGVLLVLALLGVYVTGGGDINGKIVLYEAGYEPD